MSTVNLAETLIRLYDRQPRLAPSLQKEIWQSGIKFVPPSIEHAELAAQARLRYPLNLGDCFAYALAQTEGLPLLTLDSDFKQADIVCIMPKI